MKSIKDPAETRKIEGFKALKLLEKAEKDLVDVMVDVRVNKSHEEIQKRCNMMSDYMAYDGPEEDDTRQPQPDEPEEYWREKKCKLIEFIKYETYEQMKKESKVLKTTEYDLGYMQGLCCIRNLLYETEVNEWGVGFFAGIKKAIEVIEYKPNIERDLNVYYAENQFKIQNIMGKTKEKEEVK